MATYGTGKANRSYLFRLQILIIDGGLLVLRNVLDQVLITKGITFDACLKNERASIRQLQSRGVITKAQYDTLFPTGGKLPATSDIDITLMIFLLRNLKSVGLNKKFNWNVAPAPTDVSLEADIWRLKDHRNNVSHISTTTEVDQTVFTTRWNDIEQILIRHSSPVLNIQQKIDEFKNNPLDDEDEKRIQELIEKWQSYDDRLIKLKDRVEKLEQRQDDAVMKLKDRVEKLEQRQDDAAFKSYEERKGHLKDDLISSYRCRHSNIQLTPLFKKEDTPLCSFYIRPDITSVESLSDMFKTDGEKHREVYLSAEAGLGKTTFSKYLAISWCQAHCPDEKEVSLFEKDDIACLHEFEFVFLVLLRDSYELCSVDDLVFKQVFSNLAHSKMFTEDFLQEILHRETCLVILDGLDEWTHPTNNPCYREPKSTPHRNDRKKCTILTTTRPWKLSVLNLSSNELGKEVALSQLSTASAIILVGRALQRLKSIHDKEILDSKVNTFMKEIECTKNEDLTNVPLLLMYIICLWCDGIEIGNSQCELYVNIVELLLSRTAGLESCSELSGLDIPECFTGHCKTNFPFLVDLGKLAYHTLLNEERENTLVFNRSVAETYLNEHYLKLGFRSGILTENTSRTLSKEISKISFPHKTVQEFFAATFISSRSNDQNAVLEKCKSVKNILDMSSVCQFISGMNAAMMCKISERFTCVINEDEETRSYRMNIENGHTYTLRHINMMFLSCLKEMHEKENLQLCLQDLFIDEDSKQDLQLLPRLNKKYIKTLSIDTYSKPSFSLRKIIALSSLTDLKYLQKLHYGCVWGQKKKKRKEADLSCLLSPCLQTLSLHNGKWSYCQENLRERLERIQYLQCLYISEFTFTHEALEVFINFISSKKALKEIKLYWVDCLEHGRDCERMFRLDLSQHCHLTKVDLCLLPPLQLNIATPSVVDVGLWAINLGESSKLLSPEVNNIKSMKLQNLNVPPEVLHALFCVDDSDNEKTKRNRLLSSFQKRSRLSSGNLKKSDEGVSKSQEQFPNLQYLCIENFKFSQEMLGTFSKFISSKNSLKEVKLFYLDCKKHNCYCEMKLDFSKLSLLTKIHLDSLHDMCPVQLNISTASLVDVKLSYIYVREGSLLLSSEMLNIKRVELDNIAISAESLQNNVKVLEKLPQSVTVVIKCCHILPKTKRKRFRNYILTSENFDFTQDVYHGKAGWSFVFTTRTKSKK